MPALAYFSKIFKLHFFLSNLPSKKGWSNVAYPMRVRVKILFLKTKITFFALLGKFLLLFGNICTLGDLLNASGKISKIRFF
jgi:hypothetical protein